MSEIGSLAWGRRNGGQLTSLEWGRLVAQVFKLRAVRLLSRQGATPKLKRALSDHSLEFPDTGIVRQALEQCRAECSPALAAHSCRTFLWGTLFGATRSLKDDEETFAVAALLHDLELGKTATRQMRGCSCFAVAGALRAEAFVHERKGDPAMARCVANAIALHLNLSVPVARGAEAHLLQAGAAADVVGAGLGEIAPEERRAVIAKYPREGFKDEMLDVTAREAAAQPRTRSAFLMSLGFARIIKAAPYDQ